MSRGSGGKIINVASLLAFQGGISVPAHPASKGAVVQLTKALANEWAAQGVNVNAITLGLCAPTTPPRCNAMKFAIVRFSTASRSAMGRTERYLWSGGVSCLGNYIHGHVLVVDGGGWADSGRADDAIFLEASVTCSKVYLSSNLVCFNSRNGRCTGGCS